MCYNSIIASNPQYLADLLQIYTPSRTLRSTADTRKRKISLFQKKFSGHRSFSYQGPVTWNNLPFSIRHTQTYSSFKSQLKPHLFSQTFQKKLSFYAYDYYEALCIWFAIKRCVHGPCIAALHVLIALIILGCVHVWQRFAVSVGLSGVCMFYVLIVMLILVLNCELLWTSLVGLGAILMLHIIKNHDMSVETSSSSSSSTTTKQNNKQEKTTPTKNSKNKQTTTIKQENKQKARKAMEERCLYPFGTPNVGQLRLISFDSTTPCCKFQPLILMGQYKTCANFRGKALFPCNNTTIMNYNIMLIRLQFEARDFNT